MCRASLMWPSASAGDSCITRPVVPLGRCARADLVVGRGSCLGRVLSDHAKNNSSKNCASNPHCLIGLGEKKEVGRLIHSRKSSSVAGSSGKGARSWL